MVFYPFVRSSARIADAGLIQQGSDVSDFLVQRLIAIDTQLGVRWLALRFSLVPRPAD
jgi:hypothetical protein